MRRGAAEAVKEALKKEKSRVEHVETENFFRMQQREKEKDSWQKYPRSLANQTFFTPHLSKQVHTTYTNEIVANYALIVKLHGKSVISISNSNPMRTPMTRLPRNLSKEDTSLVYKLEKQGFRFNGTNKDILVFEKLYNQKQRNWRWASKSAFLLTGSVFVLTTALFVGEKIVLSKA